MYIEPSRYVYHSLSNQIHVCVPIAVQHRHAMRHSPQHSPEALPISSYQSKGDSNEV